MFCQTVELSLLLLLLFSISISDRHIYVSFLLFHCLCQLSLLLTKAKLPDVDGDLITTDTEVVCILAELQLCYATFLEAPPKDSKLLRVMYIPHFDIGAFFARSCQESTIVIQAQLRQRMIMTPELSAFPLIVQQLYEDVILTSLGQDCQNECLRCRIQRDNAVRIINSLQGTKEFQI